MRPVTFAGDDILEAVAVDIDQLHCMKLRKLDAVEILLRLVGKNSVLDKIDRPILLHLLKPGEPEGMAIEAGDHIVVAVAIDIVGMDLRPAVAELESVFLPERGRCAGCRFGCRLLPPAFCHEQVSAFVAIDIPHAEAMLILPPLLRLGAGPKRPALAARRPGGTGHPQHAGSVKHQLRAAVAGHIDKVGRLVVNHRMGQVSRPIPARSARIAKPNHLLAGPHIHHHIEPAIGIDVAHGSKKIVGIFERIEILGRIDLVPHLELGAGIPVGAVDGIAVAVFIEIAQRRPFGMKALVQHDPAKRHLFPRGRPGPQSATSDSPRRDHQPCGQAPRQVPVPRHETELLKADHRCVPDFQTRHRENARHLMNCGLHDLVPRSPHLEDRLDLHRNVLRE